MNLKRYTEKSQEAMLGAQQLAERSHHPQIEPEHLLLTLVDQSGGVVPSVLRKLGVEPSQISEAVQGWLKQQPHQEYQSWWILS